VPVQAASYPGAFPFGAIILVVAVSQHYVTTRASEAKWL